MVRTWINGYAMPLLQVTCDGCTAAEAVEFLGRPAVNTPGDPADWLLSLGVNTRKHGRCTVENFDAAFAPLAPRAATDFIAETLAAGKHDRVRGLYLVHEAKGTGKSHLAVAIMRAVHEANPRLRVVYDPADRLIAKVQDSYGTGTTDRLIEDRRLADLYVLDDLGREKGTDDALRTLATILDEREGAPTVITANAPPEELAKRYRDGGLFDRVASRLGDDVYRYVSVPGPDRRFRRAG